MHAKQPAKLCEFCHSLELLIVENKGGFKQSFHLSDFWFLCLNIVGVATFYSLNASGMINLTFMIKMLLVWNH